VGTLVPVIGLVQVGLQSMADRYTYLPSIGIAILVAWGIPSFFKNAAVKRKILLPGALVVLGILAAFTWRQCGYWKNSLELFSHTLNVTKNNFLAYNNRGNAYAKIGRYQAAIDDYNKALQIKPQYSFAFYNRGFAYYNLGLYRQAIEDYSEAIRLNPRYTDAYNNRGIIYLLQGHKEEGCADARKACALGKCRLLEIAKSKKDCP
jgi:tetratricopeptide (TPR) repeat protein